MSLKTLSGTIFLRTSTGGRRSRSDAEAYAAFQLVVDEEGMQAFLDEDNVTPFPRGRR
jgi:hypothetical protein